MISQRFSILSCCLSLTLAFVLGCERTPLTALDRARALYRSGNWSQTIVVCNELLGQNPDDRGALQLRGRAHLAMQKFDQSIVDFSRLAELDPTDHETYYYRSMAYEGIGDRQLAEADRTKGRELDPLRKSAYTFSPANFMPQSAPLPIPPRPPDPPKSDSDKYLSNVDSKVVRGDDSETTPSPFTRRTLPSTGTPDRNEKYVRDAVDDFRRMISETATTNDSKKKRSKEDGLRSLGTLSDIGLDPTKPKADGIANNKDDKPESDNSAKTPPQPALSTALPPGMAPMGLSPWQSPYAIASQPGNVPPPTAAPNAPQAGVAPPSTQIPYVRYGLPGLSGTPGQTIIQPNPIHAPGSKPVLSTSLPPGALRVGPGIASPPPAAAPYGELPTMLPGPVRRYDVP